MKKMSLLAVIVIAGSVGGCNSIFTPIQENTNQAPQNKVIKSSPTTAKITTKYCKLKPFHSIQLGGDAKIELAHGSYAIKLQGINADKYDCKANIVDQVLYVGKEISSINTNADTKKTNINNNQEEMITSLHNVSGKITTPALKNITVHDNAKIRTENFKSCNPLTITAKDNGTINFAGKFNIDKIMQSGNGPISINWINSHRLFVSSNNNGPIHLAGSANDLVIKATSYALINTRYLRAKQTSVVAADKAEVTVTATNELRAYAVDNSNVYYHKKPPQLTVVTNNAGNVLQLR